MSVPLNPSERIARLRLARTERVGPVAFLELIRREGSAVQALRRLPELARGRGGSLRIPTVDEIEAELDRGEACAARLLVLGDADYPRSLATLEAPAPVLWVAGDAELLRRDTVALVGARVASAAGQKFAQGLAVEVGRAGFVVASGLARGIDAAAHIGALSTGTVAVLGGGVDDIYPPQNADLYARMVAEGCVVSESPVGHRAQARDFPRRNRIISGLSRAVVVVEAEMRSGSLITARLAAEQGREVLAVPGSPLDPRCAGTNDLIRQGAALCAGLDDVLRALERPHGLFEPAPTYCAERDAPPAADLSERILALLGPTPTSRDDLIRAVGAPAGQVMGALLELTLCGQVVLADDGSVVRS
ncbi:MAG: DNA-processing protein DprA [Caulobacterales bacterium]|nr:DNA-processing protein DprA [Caulobacterales bacterium]